MIFICLLISLLAATACHAASPNQTLWRPAHRRWWLRAGVLMQLLALCAWTLVLGAASGIFNALGVAMLAWVALPYLALLSGRGAAR